MKNNASFFRFGLIFLSGFAGLFLYEWCLLHPASIPIIGPYRLEPYILVGLAAFFGWLLSWIPFLGQWAGRPTLAGRRVDGKKNQIWPLVLGAVLFAGIMALANYPRWLQEGSGSTAPVLDGIALIVWLMAGFWAGWYGLHFFGWLMDRLSGFKGKSVLAPRVIFWVSFVLLEGLFLFFFFKALYPGLWNTDSLSQIRQAWTHTYSNYHPVVHTWLISLFMKPGYAMNASMNTALASYALVQTFLLAGVLAFSISTVYRALRSWLAAGLMLAWTMGSYYNWFYAVTVLKDVVFAVTCLLMVTSLFRIVYDLGGKRLNYTLFVLGTLGTATMRSNGLYAIAGLLVLLLLFAWKNAWLIKGILAGSILFTLVLTGPVYRIWNIEEVRIVESLSIPVQQVARVIYRKRELTPLQKQEIEKLKPIEYIQTYYTPWIADPIKFAIPNQEDQYLKEHMSQYKELYLELLKKYPWDFVSAWVDETIGYWNSGYDYYRVLAPKDASTNDLNLENTIPDPAVLDFMNQAEELETGPLVCMVSIGFFAWLSLAVWLYEISRRKKGWPASSLILMILGTLFIATPVYAEFRYAYFMMISLPLLLNFCIYNPSAKENV